MKKICFFLIIPHFLFSCAVFQPHVKLSQELKLEPKTVIEEPQELIEESQIEESQAEIDELSAVINEPEPETIITGPVYIMGKGKADEETLALFLLQTNPLADLDFVRVLAGHYINESAYEGINHDVAFSQMCLETGFLGYGGLVQPEWNNFCGLGAIGPDEPGLIFPDPQTGVRAHIQHLKAYATEEPLNGELVDPRYRYVRKGSSPAIDGLSGTWAADRRYAVKIRAILQRLHNFSL